MIPKFIIRYGWKHRLSDDLEDVIARQGRHAIKTLPGTFTEADADIELDILKNEDDDPLFFAYKEHLYDDYDPEGQPLLTPENALS